MCEPLISQLCNRVWKEGTRSHIASTASVSMWFQSMERLRGTRGNEIFVFDRTKNGTRAKKVKGVGEEGNACRTAPVNKEPNWLS